MADEETIVPLRAADSISNLRYYSEDEPARVLADVVSQANAGAALTHAIYHGGADFVLSMPDPVTRAYVAACLAYGIRTPRTADEADA
jgi:hypothetical protein